MFKELELVSHYCVEIKLEKAKEIFMQTDEYVDSELYLFYESDDGVLIFKG